MTFLWCRERTKTFANIDKVDITITDAKYIAFYKKQYFFLKIHSGFRLIFISPNFGTDKELSGIDSRRSCKKKIIDNNVVISIILEFNLRIVFYHQEKSFQNYNLMLFFLHYQVVEQNPKCSWKRWTHKETLNWIWSKAYVA